MNKSTKFCWERAKVTVGNLVGRYHDVLDLEDALIRGTGMDKLLWDHSETEVGEVRFVEGIQLYVWKGKSVGRLNMGGDCGMSW